MLITFLYLVVGIKNLNWEFWRVGIYHNILVNVAENNVSTASEVI